MEIRANPGEIRTVAQRIHRASGSLTEMESTIGAVYGQLSWEAREKAQVDGQVSQARTRAGQLAGQLADLGRALASGAQMLEDADRSAASQWEGVGAGFEGILRQWMRDPVGQLLNMPWESVARTLGLGGLLGAVPSIVLWFGPGSTANSSVSGFDSRRLFDGLGHILGIATYPAIYNWLKGSVQTIDGGGLGNWLKRSGFSSLGRPLPMFVYGAVFNLLGGEPSGQGVVHDAAKSVVSTGMDKVITTDVAEAASKAGVRKVLEKAGLKVGERFIPGVGEVLLANDAVQFLGRDVLGIDALKYVDVGAPVDWAGDKVVGGAEWVGGKATDAGGWAVSKAADAGGWATNKVGDAWNWAWHH